ncbi:MAG: hypothetical protein GX538_00630 [Gammaproteobacteria bacterium]|nr:hypothetical protein [Gammaproteobacteria bacterium]
MGVSALIRSALIPALAFMMAAAGAIAHASDAGDGNAVTQMATQLRADLAAGEKYPDLAESDRRRVLELLARMETRMGAADSIDELTSRNQVRMYNDQNEINAILTGSANDDRLVCQRMRISGSHRKQNICITAAEWEERTAIDKAKFERYRQMTTN